MTTCKETDYSDGWPVVWMCEDLEYRTDWRSKQYRMYADA